MTTLKMAFHDQTGRRVVEVFDDRGTFVAGIYPTDDGSNSVHIISYYFADKPIKPSPGNVPMPGLLVCFKERTS